MKRTRIACRALAYNRLMSEYDEGWIAGILEGEGCFLRSQKGHITLQVRMTDADTMQRLGSLLGGVARRVHPPSWQRRGWQAQYELRINGGRAVQIMQEHYSRLSQRRKEQIDRATGIRTLNRTG